jgi:hypothetical protein
MVPETAAGGADLTRLILHGLVMATALWAAAGTAHGQDFAPNPLWPRPAADACSVGRESDCFAKAEVAVVFPHLDSFLVGPVTAGPGGPTGTIDLRNAHLNATTSPLVQLGAYRFGPGYGEVAFSYRLLATDGTDALADGAATLRSRLNLQTFSFDYLRHDCPLGDDTTLDWEVGARIQVVFFDTQARSAEAFAQARNYFFGIGPHAGAGVTKTLPNGVSLFGRFDAALLVGYNTAQDFVLTTPAFTGSGNQQQTELSPSYTVQAGAGWSPDGQPNLRWRGGYQFEQWYNLGRVNASRGDLTAHGLFVSCEFGF